MIDINKEHVLTLRELAPRVPPIRKGKACHVHTVYRWTKTGRCGVVLESVVIGGRRCTSLEAYQRFSERLTAIDREKDGRHRPGGRSAAERERASRRAAGKLDQLGC